MATEDNSFVKQSLTETLTGQTLLSRKPTLGKGRFINSKDMASRKAKADEESGGILKSLGLTPTGRRANKSSSEKEAVTDWEEVATPSKTIPTSQESIVPSTIRPGDITQLKPQSHASSSSENHPRQASPSKSPNESIIIANLRRQLLESQKSRDELNAKNTRLERELIDIKSKTEPGNNKVLALREYKELEREFDAQEKLLSGYQRENERSLIELESTKLKISKMSALLSKVCGPDWEESMMEPTIDSTTTTTTTMMSTNRSPSRTLQHSHIKTLPNDPAQKLELQLAQVQLLIQAMERRLVTREAQLIDLNNQSKLDHQKLIDSFNLAKTGVPSKP
ncbi:hypothetical protein MJO28_002605 [Puccinia striiformis f. sp. tritici]|uniref:Uncharacterized protein n=3 Tax=Puccinia striiformis TaxID=27350 RepID=A0A2S4UEU3_9BASI|nr:hypothetical protein MJO28_002605 [Puccinia striiformis f. sp. tritici]POV95812.1 hypothetical protein PSTT_16013 [Puccinia striiformis]POW08487.1 hypothetical protein PSHT_09513 [Puccinia striiformis]